MSGSVGVLGLARSGEAAARLALRHEMRVYASDAADTLAARAAVERLRALGADAEAGNHDVDRLAACDRIVLSPGIPPTAPVLTDPRLAAVTTIAELEFAWEHLDAPVVAVTGTNGKTTVTALVSHLLGESGIDAPAGGNIGVALSDLALREPPPQWAVVEVSSFQLAGTRRFAPAIGVLTNLAPDHLDRYGSVAAYYADKARLFRNAGDGDRWILNADDPEVLALAAGAAGTRYLFSVERRLEPGEFGAWMEEDGRLVLRTERGEPRVLLHRDELRILGLHNVANALAASLAAKLAGGDPAAIAHGLRSFAPPAHRLQPVVEKGGVLWINDSKATNLASARVALRSVDRPVVLLLGGRHKGEPYSGLLPELRSRARGVVAFGEAAERIERDLAAELIVERVNGDFAEAVRRAGELARPGDAVLLSPACSSYDMFADYEERGECFARLARGEAEG
ncbi:UDP-N-acetylmuramoyl-L-alanine--D-glutamate ligase [soil metagenome]